VTDARYACYCRIVTILSGSVTLGNHGWKEQEPVCLQTRLQLKFFSLLRVTLSLAHMTCKQRQSCYNLCVVLRVVVARNSGAINSTSF
jgi:hypothetical protein